MNFPVKETKQLCVLKKDLFLQKGLRIVWVFLKTIKMTTMKNIAGKFTELLVFL